MELDLNFVIIIANQLGGIFKTFYNSGFFFVLRFFLFIYIIVLFVDIILLLIARGLGSDIRAGLKGMDVPVASKNKMVKRWESIVDRLKTGSSSQIKVAILEADKMADEFLQGFGYEGKDMTEKLEKANVAQIENLEELRHAHKIRNKIIFEKDFEIDEKTAKELVETYEEFLKSMEVF